MNPDSENFNAVRRLLALKRHEQPPPGYFNNFSSQVISRIKAGEGAEPASSIGRLFAKAGWWQHLVAVLEAKPAFAGAFGAAVCALLISGIVYSENGPTPVSAALMEPEAGSSLAPATVAVSDSLNEPQFVSAGTNAISPSPASLWNDLQSPKAQLISFPASSN
jgi:hypothetical protein